MGTAGIKNVQLIPRDRNRASSEPEYLAKAFFSLNPQHSTLNCFTPTRWSARLPHHDDQRLGVVGWGVGGIEAEAGMLGQPVYFLNAGSDGRAYDRTIARRCDRD